MSCKNEPSNVTVTPLEDCSGYYFAGWVWSLIKIDNDLPARGLMTTPIHEWFHVVQDNHWTIAVGRGRRWVTGRGSAAYKTAVEGTAEWASDLPIPLRPEDIPWRKLGKDRDGLATSITADEVNDYFWSRRDDWVSDDLASDGLFGRHMSHDGKTNLRPYESVFFWKYFAHRAGSGEDDLAAMKKFWDKFHGRNYYGRSQFIETVGSLAPTTGRRQERFRKFYEDYVGATLGQMDKAGRIGLTDDAFSADNSWSLNVPYKIFSWSYYSKRPETVPSQPARNEREIQQRLSRIARRVQGIKPYGLKSFVIELPGRYPSPRMHAYGRGKGVVRPRRNEVTHLFLQVAGDSTRKEAWGAVALTHHGRKAEYRGADKGRKVSDPARRIDLKSLDFSLQEARTTLSRRPLAYYHMRSFNEVGRTERIWLGLINLDETEKARWIEVAYAATPFFEAYYQDARDKPRGRLYSRTGTVRFIESQPARVPPKESFESGDVITVEVDLSDAVHLGAGDDIPAKRRTLSAEVFDTRGRKVAVEKESYSRRFNSGNRYRYRFALPESIKDYGTYTIVFKATSLLKLGPEDEHTDDSFKFTVSEARPIVKRVRLHRDGAPAFLDSRSGAFRPVTPGEVKVEILFDRKMNVRKPPEIKFKDQAIEGHWSADARGWRAKFTVPDGKEYTAWKGVHTLSIQAEAENGKLIDADSAAAVDQPDTRHRFVIDAVPPVKDLPP